jgi:aspartate aminotransferase
MIFSNLQIPPPDPTLALMLAYAADKDPDKIDLTIGVYRDESGSMRVLKSVKRDRIIAWLLS